MIEIDVFLSVGVLKMAETSDLLTWEYKEESNRSYIVSSNNIRLFLEKVEVDNKTGRKEFLRVIVSKDGKDYGSVSVSLSNIGMSTVISTKKIRNFV